MDYTYKDLKIKTVAQLKEIAKSIEHEAVKGYTQLNKEHLIQAICTALGIDTFEHHHVEGLNKSDLKKEIRKLKKEHNKALEAHDSKQLKAVRQQLKKLKNKLRRSTFY